MPRIQKQEPTNQAGEPLGYTDWIFWCPGCKQLHSYRTKNPPGVAHPCWSFNGNEERPTFEPSLLYYTSAPGGGRNVLCHLFLRDGQLQFLSDCPHHLMGQTVPLPELPC